MAQVGCCKVCQGRVILVHEPDCVLLHFPSTMYHPASSPGPSWCIFFQSNSTIKIRGLPQGTCRLLFDRKERGGIRGQEGKTVAVFEKHML